MAEKLKKLLDEIVFKLLVVGALALAALVGYAVLPSSLQNVSVEASESLDAQNSHKAVFAIINSGKLPLFDLQYSYGVQTVETADGIRVPGNEKPLFDGAAPLAKLWPNERGTIEFPLKDSITSPVTFVDLTMTVRYKPIPKIPFYTRDKTFHFMTTKKKGNLLSWYLQP